MINGMPDRSLLYFSSISLIGDGLWFGVYHELGPKIEVQRLTCFASMNTDYPLVNQQFDMGSCLFMTMLLIDALTIKK